MQSVDDKTSRKDIIDLLQTGGIPKANFVVLTGQDIGHKYEINKAEIVIGRGEDAEIIIDDEDVSRHHAKVEARPDSFIITDLGSTNGMLVNGTRVKSHRLLDGDRVQVGSCTILKFNFLDDLEESFNEQLYNAANKDFLTQIYNKKYFWDRLKMEFSYSRRHEVPLSLIIFDIDHFKKINDTHGHDAGDYILRELTGQISAIKRQEDLFARWGGEEFVLLLRDTTKDDAIQTAEKLRARVEEVAFEYDEKKIPVTISAGVATFVTSNYKSHETFFRATDMQLLKAKNSGRNQVKFPAGS
jgi:two-component system, cell cycle response regulator